jgi:DNA-binding NtrC family response regulator
MPLPRIAIIEADTDTRDIASLILSSGGYAVSTFVDCEIALPHILAQPPAMILLDLNLQSSIVSPQHFVETVRSNKPELKILLVSGSPNVDTIAKAMQLDGILIKPFDPESLITAVRKALN